MFRFVTVLACIAAALADTKYSLDEKIIGGSSAAPGQFPYQISMRKAQTGQHLCGGTIISPTIIVTAAHCVYQQYVTDFIVVVGTNTLNQGGVVYGLADAVYHGGYNPQIMFNDIALLKTSSPIQFNALVQPAPLQQSEVPAGASLVLSGWGLTSWPGQAPPNDLKFAFLTAIDINSCAQALAPGQLNNNQICTYNRPGQGACAGDSGGPLVYNGALAGVVSYGRPCAIGFPDVFTKVASYIPWIQQTSRTLSNA